MLVNMPHLHPSDSPLARPQPPHLRKEGIRAVPGLAGKRAKEGFTLIELLAVIATIAILIALAIPAWQQVRYSLDKQATVHSLRSIGQAISLYAVDHDGELPGPLVTANFAYYTSTENRRIGYHLWSYLDLPAPTPENYEAEILTNPAYLRMRTSDTAPVYRFTDRLEATNGQPFVWYPWGYRNSQLNAKPMTLTLIAPYGLSETVAVTELDQLNSKSAIASTSPATPPLGDIRMSLYFDWHVAPVDVE